MSCKWVNRNCSLEGCNFRSLTSSFLANGCGMEVFFVVYTVRRGIEVVWWGVLIGRIAKWVLRFRPLTGRRGIWCPLSGYLPVNTCSWCICFGYLPVNTCSWCIGFGHLPVNACNCCISFGYLPVNTCIWCIGLEYLPVNACSRCIRLEYLPVNRFIWWDW